MQTGETPGIIDVSQTYRKIPTLPQHMGNVQLLQVIDTRSDTVYGNSNQANFLYTQIPGAVAGNGSLEGYYVVRKWCLWARRWRRTDLPNASTSMQYECYCEPPSTLPRITGHC